MSVTIPAIMKRMEELGISASVRENKLVLRAAPGVITEKAKEVISENKSNIIAYILASEKSSQVKVPFEERIASVFPGGCQITSQPKGYTLTSHVAHLRAEQEKKEAARQQKEPWSKEAWERAEAVQFARVEEYRKKWFPKTYPVPESTMGPDGFMRVPMPKGWKRNT